MISGNELVNGVQLVRYSRSEDDRGFFLRHFSRETMDRDGLNPSVDQANLSYNRSRLTMRGFHYQADPHGEDKTISVLRGKILLAVVDVDPASSTYREHSTIELTEFGAQAHVGKLKATAFLTLTDDVLVHYFMSAPYVPAAARGFRYDDPAFNVPWPTVPAVVSERDLAWPPWVEEAHEDR